MKKLFLLLVAFTFVILNSCREDGDWQDGNNTGQFGFSIERDNNFIEKSVGESNDLKFNIVPNYDFNTVKTSFKFTTNLNGVLKLNGEVLTANKEYDFTSKNNIFQYIGNVSGTHDLEISVKNDKGASTVEKFELKYSVSDFTLTYTGGTADIYQGDETNYLHKITPQAGQPTTGYEIKFESYEGDIKFNGVPASLGQFYPINNIDNFTVTLKALKAGQGKLTYTIKNSTVSKSYEIQQNVIARKIVLESMNINSLNVLPNTPMSLTGIIIKTPATSNTTIQYKTWLSSASNNNLNGIQTTNNVYTNYALGANGSFTVNFNSVAVGKYTLNIQAKDEFGNESEIKSFEINVEPQLRFEGAQNITVKSSIIDYGNRYSIKLDSFTKTFKVIAGGSASISKIDYVMKFTSNYGNPEQKYSETITTGNTVDYNNVYQSGEGRILWTNLPYNGNFQPGDAFCDIIVTSSTGETLKQTVKITY